MQRSARLAGLGRLVVVLVIAAGAWLPAAAGPDEADAWFEKGRQALAQQKPIDAAEAFSRARELAPQRADVCYHLARAYEEDGRAEDAIAFYHETSRLDPEGPLGRTARADEKRLRALWVRVELEAGTEHLGRGRFVDARAAFANAFDVAVDSDLRAERARAREGYARAGAREVAREALKAAGVGGAATVSARLLPTAWVGQRGALAEMAEVLEAELSRALREQGARVVSADAAATDVALTIRGRAGQRFIVTAEDARGSVVAEVALRALVDASAPGMLPPEVIELDLAIEAERDDQRPPRRIAVGEGAVLVSNDRFRIRARPSRDCYLYAVMIDSQGQAVLLYPGTEKLFPDLERAGVRTVNPAKGAVDVVIPPRPPTGEPFWFYLDEHVGQESFYVAAAVVPLDDIEDLIVAIRAVGDEGRKASGKLAEALAERAADTRIEPSAGGQVLRGRGAVVRYISFEHR